MMCALGLWLGFLSAPTDADPPYPDDGQEMIGGDSETQPIQPASATLDRTTATVTRISAPSSASPPLTNQADYPFITAAYEGGQIKVVPPTPPPNQKDTTDALFGAEATTIVAENFEGDIAPGFEVIDQNGDTGGVYGWGLAPCFSTTGFPVDSIGNRSVWVAGETTTSPTLDPCNGDDYPADLDSWLVYGPFSLADAQVARLDFYFRLDNGGDSDDRLSWYASRDGTNFEGQANSGIYTSGPFPNGHNFVSFDLTDVNNLGDLTGEPEVWIAFRFESDSDAETGRGAFIDSVSIRKNSGAKREIVLEPFETAFPDGYEAWLSHDNNGPSIGGNVRWGSADCTAQSGTRSMWVARYGADGLDPCGSSVDYPPSTDSWLIYGPFNLENASEAWVDFYFRSDSETISGGDPLTGDVIYWWASLNGSNYRGPGTSGTYTQGPYENGYNLMRFDLSNVPTLGDLRGESLVWLGFVFQADDDANVGAGPFLDDVNLVAIEQASRKIYLPLVVKAEVAEPPPTGGITFRNLTGNPVIIELLDVGRRTFPGTEGPHVWDNISPGIYDWIASGTCPAGAGQVGSVINGRQKVTIVADVFDNPINVENGGNFDCSG